MGIEGLRPFLQELNPDIFRKVPLSAFKGSRVAIDIAFWLHKNANGTWRPLASKCKLNEKLEIEVNPVEFLIGLFRRFVDFLVMLMKEGITPLCIFDGDHPKLKEVKYARYKKINEDLEKKFANLKEIVLNANQIYNPTMIEASRDKLVKLYAAKADVSSDDYEQISMWIRQLGIPYLAAKGEAEALASYLCIEGIVSAVYSKDTDTMVYGCPRCIFDICSSKAGTNVVELMEVYPILRTLNFPFTLFRDMCILMQTDFNTRLKGLGEKKIYDGLKDTQSLELFLLLSKKEYRDHPTYAAFCNAASTNTKAGWSLLEKATEESLKALYIAENRDIFKYRASKDEIKYGKMDMGKVDLGIRSTLRMYQIEGLIDALLAAMIDLPLPKELGFWYPAEIPGSQQGPVA